MKLTKKKKLELIELALNSQDLGGKSIPAILDHCKNYLNNKSTINQLRSISDPITLTIVFPILENEDEDDLINAYGYAQNMIKRAVTAVEKACN